VLITSGPGLSDIYRVLVTGLNGTPMPGFLETLTEEQRWELTAFIQELRQAQSR
jgi:mono/diheme cytochrome c family protein